MTNKPPYTIDEQINLLKLRGMLFKEEANAQDLLKNISYYRLKGYWWDMQDDYSLHTFKPETYFEDVIARYNFDSQLRTILFDALETIEIALRTKMIYHLSLKYGGLWYLNESIFIDNDKYKKHVEDLKKEFVRSQELFIKDQKIRHPNTDADSWKILEIASFGTLSKLYKNLQYQLEEKTIIAKEFGLNRHSELYSWLEPITYIRNIIAHHSRLWSRNMVKKPTDHLNNPKGLWFANPLTSVQTKKPFLIISCMVYLCNQITPNHQIKTKILKLIEDNPKIPIYKLGFLNNWENEPIWKV